MQIVPSFRLYISNNAQLLIQKHLFYCHKNSQIVVKWYNQNNYKLSTGKLISEWINNIENIMRIDSFDSVNKPPPSQPAVDASTKAETQPTSRASKSDRANVSNLSQRMLDIEQSISASEPFDMEKVNRIKLAIREGEYRIRPEAIANRVLESARMMIGAHAPRQATGQRA